MSGFVKISSKFSHFAGNYSAKISKSEKTDKIAPKIVKKNEIADQARKMNPKIVKKDSNFC